MSAPGRLHSRMDPDLQQLLERVEEDAGRPHSIWGDALDLVGDAVVVMGTDRRILYYSRGASELTGFTPDEVLGTLCTDGLKCLDCRGRCRLFEEGRVCHREIEIEARDGRRIPVIKKGRLLRDRSGKILCGVETLHDVSDLGSCREELTRVAAQLESERTLLEAFAETVSDGVVTVDLKGRVASLSLRAADLLGVKPSEGRGRPLVELIEDDGSLAPALPLLLAEGGRVDLPGVRAVRAPRSGPTLALRLVGLRAESGRLVGAALALRPESMVEVHRFHGLVGSTEVMRRLAALVEALAAGDTPVLVTGETGTGKERVARALHLAGPRAQRPFVAVNCTSPNEALLEGELFGYAPGALPGVPAGRPGRLEEAEDGTLYLYEVAGLPSSIQARLQRALESRTLERVGGGATVPLAARIVASTSTDLEEAVQGGALRQDLYYRLRVVPLRVPPLRERRDDVPLLAAHFAAEILGREPCLGGDAFTPAALEALAAHDWPGNVRELRNAVQYALATGGGPPIDLCDLPPEVVEVGPGGCAALGERRRIEQVLQETHYNRAQAAERLGISRTTLWRRMRQYGLG